MTMIQLQRRLDSLEQKIGSLETRLEYQQAIEGIRRGLESVQRGEGKPARKVFAEIRRNARRRRK